MAVSGFISNDCHEAVLNSIPYGPYVSNTQRNFTI